VWGFFASLRMTPKTKGWSSSPNSKPTQTQAKPKLKSRLRPKLKP
jgi:hypothetical protein